MNLVFRSPFSFPLQYPKDDLTPARYSHRFHFLFQYPKDDLTPARYSHRYHFRFQLDSLCFRFQLMEGTVRPARTTYGRRSHFCFQLIRTQFQLTRSQLRLVVSLYPFPLSPGSFLVRWKVTCRLVGVCDDEAGGFLSPLQGEDVSDDVSGGGVPTHRD